MNPDNIQVEYPDNLPVPIKPIETICIANLKREDRLKFIDSVQCPKMKKSLLEYEKEGFYERDQTIDYCKLERERKQQEEKQKDILIQAQADKINELQNIIIQHNTLLAQIVAKLNN